jgi:hypothetical protein
VETWTEHALADLAWHWASAFILSVSPDGSRWTAVPIADRSAALHAGSASELRTKIRSKYAEAKAPAGGAGEDFGHG